ncbi:MAG: NADH-quinone oxidoreductase subunit C [Coriobacteriales bacterium]
MLKNYNETFTELPLDELYALAEKKKKEGARFIQLHCTTLGEDDFVITYSFTDDETCCDNYDVHVHAGDKVPAISPLFLAAFVFENETHDLFGIDIDGIAIDFKGNFYQVALDRPMASKIAPGEEFSVAKKNNIEGGEE